MTRACGTCQHIKRVEIDRRLAAGEPGNQIARDYDLNPSSLHRHRVNCLGLSSSNATMKEVARGTAAVACLPSKDELNNAYFELRARIDQIVTQAEQQGSLAIAISGLNSIRHTLDSLMRLAGYDRHRLASQCRRANKCQSRSNTDRRARTQALRPRAGTESPNRASTFGDQ